MTDDTDEYAFARWVEQPVSPYAERRVPDAIESEITRRVESLSMLDIHRDDYRSGRIERDRFERELRRMGIDDDVVITIVAVEEYQMGNINPRQFAQLVDEYGVGYEPFPYRDVTFEHERRAAFTDAAKRAAIAVAVITALALIAAFVWVVFL